MPRHGQGHHSGHHRGRHFSQSEPTRYTESGLPIRPGSRECTAYLRNGQCPYGAKCRYTHDKAPAARPSTPLTPIAHHNQIGNMSATSTHMQQLGSPLRKAEGLLYPGGGMAMGKGFNTIPMEPPQNGGNNASVNHPIPRGQNNAGSMASSGRRQNGGSNSHHDLPGDVSGSGGRDSMPRVGYQNGAMYSNGITTADLASGVLHYGQPHMLDLRSSLQDHPLLAFQQVMGYNSLFKDQDQALLAGIGSEYSPVCGISTSAGVFYPSSGMYPEEIAPILNESNASEVPYVDQNMNLGSSMDTCEGDTVPDTSARVSGQMCTFEEPEHRHKGYFSTSWPFVPNPWYRPGMPNDHMQVQMRAIESPRAKGPVTRAAFMFKPERKAQQVRF